MKQLFVVCLWIFSLILISSGTISGEVIWKEALGGSEEEWGYSLDSTPDGGVIAAGVTYSTDANITNPHRNGDLWVFRLDANGKPLWNRAFGGNESDYALSVRTIADGGFVVIGTTGSNDGDIQGYHGNGDLFILRLSSSGASVWQKVYGGNRTDEGGDIVQTSDGGFMVTGYTMSDDGDALGHRGGGDLWVIRLDSSGSILWQKVFGGTGRDSGSSIIKTKDGGYIICGNTYSINGDITLNHGSSDVWVVKIDESGNLLWQKTYGGSQLDWGHSVCELPDGSLLVAGVTASLDGDVSKSRGGGDIWILKLTPDGRMIWEKTYGGSFSDNIWNIRSSPNGTAYLTGETFSVDGDITSNKGDADLYISEIDGNGTVLWQQTLGGRNYESGSWIGIAPDGNILITGTTQSSDGDVTGYRGGGDLWIMKIKPERSASLQPKEQDTKPMNKTQSSEIPVSASPVNSTVLVIPGFSAPPTDPDGDGRFEDLNGNGIIDLQDTNAFFSNYEWILTHYPAQAADFNGNNLIDFGDVNALFAEVSR